MDNNNNNKGWTFEPNCCGCFALAMIIAFLIHPYAGFGAFSIAIATSIVSMFRQR